MPFITARNAIPDNIVAFQTSYSLPIDMYRMQEITLKEKRKYELSSRISFMNYYELTWFIVSVSWYRYHVVSASLLQRFVKCQYDKLLLLTRTTLVSLSKRSLYCRGCLTHEMLTLLADARLASLYLFHWKEYQQEYVVVT